MLLGMVCYAEKQGKPFWSSSLGQMVQFDTIIFGRTFKNYFGQFVWIEKKSHYNSRVSLHEAPTKKPVAASKETRITKGNLKILLSIKTFVTLKCENCSVVEPKSRKIIENTCEKNRGSESWVKIWVRILIISCVIVLSKGLQLTTVRLIRIARDRIK